MARSPFAAKRPALRRSKAAPPTAIPADAPLPHAAVSLDIDGPVACKAAQIHAVQATRRRAAPESQTRHAASLAALAPKPA